jgi:hypothetical protein
MLITLQFFQLDEALNVDIFWVLGNNQTGALCKSNGI